MVDYKGKMEDMNGEELEKRIRLGFEFPTPPLTQVPYLGGLDEEVNYHYEELVALCPVTGIMDLYTIDINFVPDHTIPELKSLKQYFLSYKDVPISHEHLLSKIFLEFEKQIKPKTLDIKLDVAIRGGIKTTVCYKR